VPTFEYAPAPQSRDVDVKPSHGLFIGGEFTDPVEGQTLETLNPATEEVLSKVAVAGMADVDRAVRAARAAFGRVWEPMPGRERARYLFRIARILQERSRWRLRTSSTTPDGPTSSSTPASAPVPGPWVSRARSSRGTSRC